MDDFTNRTRSLLGDAAVAQLARSRVLIFGLGGVGGMVAEALARTGVGCLGLVDFDTVNPTDLNRQIIATEATIGQNKAEAMARRIRAIHSDTETIVFPVRVVAGNVDCFCFGDWHYIVDAIDEASAKLLLIQAAQAATVPVISSMGAGNQAEPTGFWVADIDKTHTCPLARVMRREARRLGLAPFKTVFCSLPPHRRAESSDAPDFRPDPADSPFDRADSPPIGSVIFGPAAAGLLLASEVVRDLIHYRRFD